MEITKAQMAGLILGHLKYEKFNETFEKFQEECSYIQRKGKHFITRVIGLSLEDILKEYAQIYTIVQGYLEETNYFEEHNGRSSLVDEINFLLDQKTSGFISTSTPSKQFNSLHRNTSVREFSNELNATSSSELPGNISDDYNRSSKKGDSSSFEKKNDSKEVCDVSNKEDVSMVLQQTLLDNRELHEKLAETINMVRAKPSSSSSSDRIREEEIIEIDAAVKAVVQHTEEDPIFNKILDEIIGTAAVSADQIEVSKTLEKERQKSYSNPSPKKNIQTHSISAIEDHNHDAIRSIIACSTKESPPKDDEQAQIKITEPILKTKVEGKTDNIETNATTPKTNLSSDIIVFNGSLDNYLKANINTVQTSAPQPIYLNTSGGLYVVPSNTVDTPAQIYVVNSQPVINMNMPVASSTSVISERDIMSMPTVIVNEENRSTTTSQILQRSIESANIPIIDPETTTKNEAIASYGCNNKKTKKLIKLLPKFKSKKKSPNKNETGNKLNAQSADKKSNTKTPENKPPIRIRTPRSGSHIRNLDFSTPPKDKPSSKNDLENSKNTTVKTLFQCSPNTKEDSLNESKEKDGKMWDSDLRELLANDQASSVQGPTPKKSRKASSHSKKRTKKDKRKNNSTEEDGLLLEHALKTPVKSQHSDSAMICEKQAITKKEFESIDDIQTDIQEAECADLSSQIKSDASDLDTDRDVTIKYSLRNCNNAPNFKRKCNMDKTCNKNDDGTSQELNVSPTKNKQTSPEETSNNKLILSPTKLNASKRSLMNVDKKVYKDELVTPDSFKEISGHPIKSRKNITPLLKTPIKMDIVPKTPNIHNCSTTSLLTPFTKIIEEQLKGIDISSIPTPNVPITPSFPLTPSCDLISPYSNRPTDYSTSSSYYQPSDNEANKSIERLLEEEKLKFEPKPNKKIVALKRNISHNQSEQRNVESNDSARDLKKKFNQNIIGKKNLNLIKDDTSSSDSSSDDESETDSECSFGNDTVICNEKPAEKINTSRYSLRKRITVDKKTVSIPLKLKETTKPLTVSVSTPLKLKETIKPLTVQETLLKELEEKRKRVMNVIKELKSESKESRKPKLMKRNQSSCSSKKSPLLISNKKSPSCSGSKKSPSCTINKKPPLLQKRKDSGKTPKKTQDKKKTSSKSKKKSISSVNLDTGISKTIDKLEAAANETENTDEDFVLHLSSDDDNIQIQKPIIKNDSDTKNDSVSDQEAEELVKGLKERGIHLMHKKSPVNISDKINKDGIEKAFSKIIGDDANCTQNTDNKHCAKSVVNDNCDSPHSDIGFEVVIYENETVCYIYNEHEIHRSLDSYNLELLNKTVSANVFDEELNMEREMNLKCSSFETLMEKVSEINILIPKRKSDQKHDNLPVIIESDQVVEENTKSISAESISNSFENNVDAADESCNLNEEKLEIVDGVIMLNSKDNENIGTSNDLMDYALTGSVREENPSDAISLSPKSKKRKASDDEEKQPDKKIKTEKELLKKMKKIDVDLFLNKVHGGASS